MARRRKDTTSKKAGTKSLARLSDTFTERRYEPAATANQYIWTVLMSLGGIGVGVGIYANVLRDESLPAVPWTNYVLAAGACMVVAYALFGMGSGSTLRVGDLGIGVEEGGKIARTAWWQIKGLALDSGALMVKRKGKTLTFPLSSNAPAVRAIVAQAMKRIPDRVELDDAAAGRVGKPSSSDGEKVDAEPPQVTGMECANSSQALTFEKDVRLCRGCGVPYHRGGVPGRCVECNKRLKKSA